MNRLAPLLAGLLAVGCYQADENDREDAGSGVDATVPLPDAGSECVPLSITMPALACPGPVPLGEGAVVRVSGAHGGCCSRGTLEATVRSPGSHQHELELGGTACECCELCPCIGPTLETEVTLEGLAVGTHVVRAGAASCSFEVVEVPCAPIEVGEVRAPAVLFEGQTFALSAWAPSSSCSCEPRLAATTGGFDASVCGCCDACECIDPTYELSYAGELPGASFEVGGVTVEVERRETSSCVSLGVPAEGGVEVFPPRADVRRSGPPIWWVRLRNESAYPACCGPLAGIETAASAENEHRLILRDCTSPCRCAGPPGQLEAWIPLVDLAPGEHRVVAAGADGGEVVSFVVPE